MFTSHAIRFAAVASIAVLSAACAAAPSGSDTSDSATPVEPAAKSVVTKTLELGDDAAIATRRASITRKKKKSQMLGDAPAVQAYIPSSDTYVVDPRTNSGLSISLVRSRGSVGDVVASVASSDPSVASATVNAGKLDVALSGKLGNSYITTYDAQGNATEKFMLLSATPKNGTLSITDARMLPTMLVTKDDRVATDFQTSDVDAMGDMADAGGHFFVQDPSALMGVIRTARQASNFQDINALYFPDLDILIHLTGGSRQGAATFDTRGSAFSGTLVTQGDFEQYVDFGGSLSASPLRDASNVESAMVDMGHGTQFASVPTVNAVVLKDGRRLAANDPGLSAVRADIAHYDVSYARVHDVNAVGGEEEEEEDIGPLHCTASAAVTVQWSSLMSVETKLDANASWNHGSPNVDLKFEPHIRVGGEVRMGGKASMGCEVELFKVPVAEWGVPLLGKVAVQVPVKIEATYDFSGSAGIITPRLEMGSAADVTKPGAIGFSYSAAGGFHGIKDIGVRSTDNRLRVTKDGVDQLYNLSANFKAGISAGLEVEASVKTWLFKASVSASIADVMFGSQLHGDFVFDGQGGYTSETNDQSGLGLFTTLEPTLHIDLKYFKTSFRLFTVDIPTVWVSHDPKSQTHDTLADDVQDIDTTLGKAKLYSDALVLADNATWTDNVVVVRGKDEYRLTAKNGELNLAGMPLTSGDLVSSWTIVTDTQHCTVHDMVRNCPKVEQRHPIYNKP